MFDDYSSPSVVLETSGKQQIDRAYSICMRIPDHSSLLVIGPKGSGKTTALRAMRDGPNVFYTEASHAKKSLTNILYAILSENGFYDLPQYTAERFNAVVRALKSHAPDGETKKTLIIDEAQKLEWTAFDDLLRVGERSGATIVFAGNEQTLVTGRQRSREALAPIASRITLTARLEPPTARDFEIFASAFGVEGMDAYKACVAYGLRTDLRSLEKLLSIARQIAGKRTVQIVHLTGAALMKHPANAEQVLTPLSAGELTSETATNGISAALSIAAEMR